jgi:[ribosomal protein S5]-alanine N-acetyltransferase
MPDRPVLYTERLIMKVLDKNAAAQVLDYYWRNRSFHQPWFAERSDQIFTLQLQKSNLEQEHADFLAGRAVPFWLCLKSDPDRIIGRLAFTSIIHGCFHSCYMAYHLDLSCQGLGLALEAAQAAIPVLFRDFGLHRIEANIIPANMRSIALAERLGFELEGFSCRYLKINGRWEDHLHYVLLADGPQVRSGSEAPPKPVPGDQGASSGQDDQPCLESASLILRPLQPVDLPSALDYYQRNQAYLERWNPSLAEELDGLGGWQRLIAAARREYAANRRLLLGLFLIDQPSRLIGVLDFKSIVPLPYSSCEVSLAIDQLLSGHGLMLEALSEAIGYVFARYCLKRINAGCCTGNERSLRLLSLLGFRQEGLARQAVFLAGQWQDVVSLALLPEDFHPI